MEQSLKQINNKISKTAKNFQNIINFARNDFQKQINIVKTESKTLEHKVELKLEQMLLSCTKSRGQITFKETSIQTENSVDAVQKNSNIMDFISHLDIHKVVVQPKNCEYEVLDIVDEDFTGDGWDEVIKAKVKCNGIISEILMSKEFATVKHDDGTETYCKWFKNTDDEEVFALHSYGNDEHIFVDWIHDCSDDNESVDEESDCDSMDELDENAKHMATTTNRDFGVNTEPMKRPCYYLYNNCWCKFTEQDCKFSHAFDCENFEN